LSLLARARAGSVTKITSQHLRGCARVCHPELMTLANNSKANSQHLRGCARVVTPSRQLAIEDIDGSQHLRGCARVVTAPHF
jgi:hypothetical protein